MTAPLPRCAPAAAGVSARSITALLDRFAADGVECHSLMIVRHGRVVAEGWWAPFSADRPHLLYSVTKSFTAIAAGLAIGDGLLSLDDRVADVLPEHVPAGASEQARRITVHHLLSMTAGHDTDSLEAAWQLEPGDLVKGFLRVPFEHPEGTVHAYDNATTFVLARMIERATGRDLPGLLTERLLDPLGAGPADFDRVGGGRFPGFSGLHLTTEAVAAFGQLLLDGGRDLVPRDWVELATRQHVPTTQNPEWSANPDALCGYGYQFWRSRHGYRADGAYGQFCLVVPERDLVVAITAAVQDGETVLDPVWECLLPGLDRPGDDPALPDRLRELTLPLLRGSSGPGRSLAATIADGPVLPAGTTVVIDPVDGGWRLHLGSLATVDAGHGEWRESAPLGRPVVACAAWQGEQFVADLYVITTPHRVRLVVDGGTATAAWNLPPLTTTDLAAHLRAPLTTRPGVA